ncbi:hypothetical protein T11_10791 [Trichinella zimbabwensis]|uniref:Uncharacterized protein n=1 Tax=Trichinella zimbabwensis TaxID=268475 RepID=A0A0V1GUR9_9BILA|nr:hypothetical protein T11_4504 [Trichinella zimbabwensis]KRZ02028.1 hypothetical protein T11_10791 [Trichinella zimbabwensis]
MLEFSAFWVRFQADVHLREDLDDATKFAYLLSSLFCEALTTIEGMPNSVANYPHAVELLKTRFGRTDAIVREHPKTLWNVKSCTDTREGIQALVDEITRHLRCLTALGKNPLNIERGLDRRRSLAALLEEEISP